MPSHIHTVHTLLLERGGTAGLTQQEIQSRLPIVRFDIAHALDALIRQKKVIVDKSDPDGWNRYKADMTKGGPVTAVDVPADPETIKEHDFSDGVRGKYVERVQEPKRLDPLRENVKSIMVWDEDKAKTYKDIMAELPWMRKGQVHSCLNQLVVKEEIRALDKKRRDPGEYPLEQYVLRRARVTRKRRKKAGKKSKAATKAPELDLNTMTPNDAGVLMPDHVPEIAHSLTDGPTPEGKARTLAALWTEVGDHEDRLEELMSKIHQIELGIEGITV